ncbi:L-ribulose-5-phosphate 4-epimerase AraD [Pelagicoccus sp. SDUM812003]|uniref:L-ribulose-5-phosphate 4-epimerase AraD n=1 Tax=Pelagicoccus sp. SDUM812003 TaxID=3041267 RepID=UPI00280E0E2F|nr:L-ribulose-5-phosphate 4-epimerase AraD [Pelagicoccus sp. SDUM812003]MDQ8205491.1 L-ribulose-5-phosphate 4-epimerase AraD [Pelagicoccus sp. SDUM812003]
MSKYQDLKEACCEANKQLPKLGIVDITFGNVSVVDRSLGVMAIKPSGVDYDDLTPDCMVVIDYEAKPDANHELDLEKAKIEGDLRPSSDTPTHMRLYQAFGDIGSVVHTHSRNATAFAQAGMAIPCMGTTHADYFYGEVPVSRVMTPEEISRHYEWETGNVIVERFKDLDPNQVNAILFNGHAPFIWGKNAKKAVEIAFALEVIAEMTMKSLMLRPNALHLTQAQLDKHYLRKHGAGAYYGQK